MKRTTPQITPAMSRPLSTEDYHTALRCAAGAYIAILRGSMNASAEDCREWCMLQLAAAMRDNFHEENGGAS